MSKTLLRIALPLALALGLVGCRYLPQDADKSCDKHVDWNDRKACKEKLSTEQKEWEKRSAR